MNAITKPRAVVMIQLEKSSGWVRASRLHPCAVCCGKKWPCQVSADGRIVLCKSANSDGRQSADGRYIHHTSDRRADELRQSLAGAVASGGAAKGASPKLAKYAVMRFRLAN